MSADPTLNPTQIGYMRRMRSSKSAQGTTLRGPIKAMANRLVRKGHVEMVGENYRRTISGDEAIVGFDAGLTEDTLEVLRKVALGEKVTHRERGMLLLVRSELVHVPKPPSRVSASLTDAGIAIAVSKGWIADPYA